MSQSTNTPGSSSGSALTTDIYRPLATQIQRPLAPFLAESSGGNGESRSLCNILAFDPSAFSSRLSGKTLLLTDLPSSSTSTLVRGRKRNPNDISAFETIRSHSDQKTNRSGHGLDGLRKVRRRLATIGRSTRIDYDCLVPLHHLHSRYLAQLLGLPIQGTSPVTQGSLPHGISPEGMQSKLVKADFTGAKLVVRSARNGSLVGISGIVIEETAGSFRLVGSDSRVRVIPKVGSQLTLSFPLFASNEADSDEDDGVDMAAHSMTCPHVEVDILGSAFAFRSSDRAGRKFRPAQGGGGGAGWGSLWVRGEWSGILDVETHDEERQADRKITKRKRGKARRKDPLAQGSIQVL